MNKKLIGSIISVIAITALVGVILVAREDASAPSDKAGATQKGHTMSNAPAPSSSAPVVDLPATNTPEGSSSSAAVTNKIVIEGMAFSPTSVKISKGTTLTWTNKDPVAHTVTGSNGKGPHSQSLSKGDSYSYTFNEVGSFDYTCTFHPDMKATVIVE